MPKHSAAPHKSNESINLWQALAQEHIHLERLEKPAAAGTAGLPSNASQSDVTTLLHAAERSALCLSGGGVRSAMFSLGILQELARFSWKESTPSDPAVLLAEFDFLSTVSGGGYTGAWFSSWAARTSTSDVIKQLVRQPLDRLKPEPLPVERVRSYASFLNPKLGFTSSDSWTLGTTILRNIVLNWLVLLPLLAGILTLPLIVNALVQIPSVGPMVSNLLVVIGFLTGACAVFYMVNDLPSAGNARGSQNQFLVLCVLALTVSGICSILYWRWNPRTATSQVVIYTVLMVFTGALCASIPSIMRRSHKKEGVSYRWILWGVLALLACAATGGTLSHWIGSIFINTRTANWEIRDATLYTWLAFPVLFFIYGIFQLLLVGVTSKLTQDEDREWWARCAAWFTMLMIAWLAGMGLVLYADSIRIFSQHELLTLTGATTLSGAVLSLIGFSPKSSSGKDQPNKTAPPSIPDKIRDLAVKLVLPVFLLLLVLTLSVVDTQLASIARSALSQSTSQPLVVHILLSGALIIIGIICAVAVNVNKFSLNGMYRLRLIRTFLGASNPDRSRVTPLTGFDEQDNLKMSQLSSIKPFHIVNIALNLVSGKNLAWQQRKAASFTASPLHCGSLDLGYVDTQGYSQGPYDSVHGCYGLSLGSAITISGAAASPNMGYHSSPLLSIVMTLFNARLGAWLPNTGNKGKGHWHSSTPDFAVAPLINEAFGLTTDTNRWVYLSDGGHFENLGLYEMVLRRCRRIVVIDGSADPDYAFEDLGNAIRKIRVDLGIEIEFKGDFPIRKRSDATGRHCAVAEIKYACVDPAAPVGELVYIKTSLNGNEPRDVHHYAEQNQSFPQQPTYDLWFDEAQLESYRRLGSHIIQEICGENSESRTLLRIKDFVNKCREHAK